MPGRRIARAVLRFVASVMIVSGLLMLADAGITLLYQEPISAVIGKLEQARLDDQLGDDNAAVAGDKRELASVGDVRRRLALLARRQAQRLRAGQAFGRIELPTLDRSYVMVEGTSTSDLRKGPGHFPKTVLPGQRGTVAVAGHRTTYGAPFRAVDQLRRGDRIVARMPYGRFTYRVEGTRIVAPTETSVTRKVGHDRLVLTACHPLYSAAKRIVVFAKIEEAEPV